MIVCIAEKPSVAQDIAKVLGATKRCEGYFEGHDYQVTWTFGHLCCLKPPEEYDEGWRRWSLSSLPMIPERFGINLIDDKGIRKQFSVIKRLFTSAERIINCGDAGQEGELIQRWVMQMAQVKCPVERLWISSLTEESIRDGFRHLKPQEQYDNLYQAGLARARGDWLLGMNATRLYTLRYGGKGQVLSIGRVQTPTLALIVNRQKEIDAFVPEPYWVLSTSYRDCVFQAAGGNFKEKSEAQKALAMVRSEPFRIDGVNRKETREAPPQLYDLTSLQVDCNKRFGYSAEATLNTIQSLYEKKLTTYPRVDTRYLSDDIHPQCRGILSSLASYYEEVAPLLEKPLVKSHRFFDSSKVTDHHAIIPTGKSASGLSDKERTVYDMIVRRFVCVFCDSCVCLETTVLGHAGEVSFRTTGKEVLELGWKRVYGRVEKESQEDAEGMLPAFTEGEQGEHSPSLSEKKTSPPEPYTEATLLRAMETAGKYVDDEELRTVLKQNGIGRPSSRAAIIETLFKRDYIRRVKKSLVPSPVGVALIETIRTELLKSCELTGRWERKLREMESGHYPPDKFLEELKGQLIDMVNAVKDDKSSRMIGLDGSSAKKNTYSTSRSSRKKVAGSKKCV